MARYDTNKHTMIGGRPFNVQDPNQRGVIADTTQIVHGDNEEPLDEFLDKIDEDLNDLMQGGNQKGVTSVGLTKNQADITGIDYEKNGSRTALPIPNATIEHNGFMSKEQVAVLNKVKNIDEEKINAAIASATTLEELKVILEDFGNNPSTDAGLAAMVAKHEQELYVGGVIEGDPDDPNPSDPIVPDNPTEEPSGEITLEAVEGINRPPSGIYTYGIYWDRSGLLQGCNYDFNCVSKRIKVNSGDTINYNIPNVSGSGLLVKINDDESTWAINETKGTMLRTTDSTSGSWTNDGEDCYVSFYFKNTENNVVSIERAGSTRSAASLLSLNDDTAADENHNNDTPSQTPTAKVSRITRLENNVDALKTRVNSLVSSGGTSVAPLTEYGELGSKYPSQVAFIKDVLMQSTSYDRMAFVHVSDNHNWSMGNAPYFTEKIGADFLVNTGDVCNSFGDSASTTISEVNNMQKPCYLVMGNHDYAGTTSQVADASSIYAKYYAPTNSHNGISTTKTYYSVVKAVTKVANDPCKGLKYIFLDQYSGLSCTSQPSTAVMSQEEINWFIDELKDASSKGYHVVCFMHAPLPTSIELVQQGWDDYFWGSGVDSGCMKNDLLPKLVDAWMNGTSYSVTYQGNTYSGTFGKGNFIGWFCGHNHGHVFGKVSGYPKQRCFATRAVKGIGCDESTVVQNSENISFVSIVPRKRSVSIYNLGEQVAINGFKRDMITYKY